MRDNALIISASAILLLFSSSCVTIRNISPPELATLPPSEKITITLLSGGAISARDIKLENGKLIINAGSDKRREIDLDKVHTLSIEKIDLLKTAAYAGVLAVSIAGINQASAWYQEKIDSARPRPRTPEIEITCCPFIYSYDGDQFVFDAEPYGGSITQGLERPEWCRLDFLKNVGGRYKILVRNELDETQFADEMKIVVVDHPQGTTVVPEVLGQMHACSSVLPPIRAYDQKGRDILPLVLRRDAEAWQSRLEEKNPASKEDATDELTFEFRKPSKTNQVKLIADAWTTFQGSRIARDFLALFGRDLKPWLEEIDRFGPASQDIWSWYFNEGLYVLKIYVETKEGWKPRGMLYGGGPFIVKERAYLLDISDVEEKILRIKLRPAAGFWSLNSLGLAFGEDAPLLVSEISAAEALDPKGRDAAPLLEKDDNRYLVLSKIGETAELAFSAPPEKPGLERTLFLKARGYYSVHLQAKGDPQAEVLEKIFHEPGFAARYALQKFLATPAGRPSVK